MGIKILIDSASDLTEKEANDLGLELLPIKVQFGEEEFLDGINLLPTDFYEKLQIAKELPKTSLINEYQFEEKFKDLTNNGDEVVVITISSKLSGTYRCALAASQKFEGVYVVDSLNATMGEKALALYALNLKEKGLSASEIAQSLEEKKSKVNVIAVVDTLKYLKIGGRISAATAFVGEMLSIKPLVAVIDGEVKVWGKSHGLKKAFSAIINKVNEIGIDYDMPSGFIWSGNDKTNITSFIDKAKTQFGDAISQMQTSQIGSTIGTHVGPGAVGMIFFSK